MAFTWTGQTMNVYFCLWPIWVLRIADCPDFGSDIQKDWMLVFFCGDSTRFTSIKFDRNVTESPSYRSNIFSCVDPQTIFWVDQLGPDPDRRKLSWIIHQILLFVIMHFWSRIYSLIYNALICQRVARHLALFKIMTSTMIIRLTCC